MQIISFSLSRDSQRAELLQQIEESCQDYPGMIFIDHPLLTSSFSLITLLSPRGGLVVMEIQEGPFHLVDLDFSKVKKELETQLREQGGWEGGISYGLYLAEMERRSWKGETPDELFFAGEWKTFIERLNSTSSSLSQDQWIKLVGLFTGALALLEAPPREAQKKNTRGHFIEKLEGKLVQLDEEQLKLSYTIPQGPQRIRGLAGTGKTIVLAIKAAHMHFKHPDWRICYTFNTQSLYERIFGLIDRIYKKLSGGKSPDWRKLEVLHGWGGKSPVGLYSMLHKLSTGGFGRTFDDAKAKFKEVTSPSELLGRCCEELLSKRLPTLFDALLIDEGHDFHPLFFQFCHRILKEPKRLIWAFDELQSLDNLSIPTCRDLFGEDGNGKTLVSLEGFYPRDEDNSKQVEKDCVLDHSYRSSRVILMTAFIFALGLFRKGGPLQTFPDVEGWREVGYEVKGTFAPHQETTLILPEKKAPNPLEGMVGDWKDLIQVRSFAKKDEELEWIAEEIAKDIQEGGLNPSDILVIGLGPLGKKFYKRLETIETLLIQKNIDSFIIGKELGADTFKIKNHVALSQVFRSKGNEDSVVYILNFEEAESKEAPIQSRNMAYTSITRAKGWCRITGTGPKMKELERELKEILERYHEIDFSVPDIQKIQRILDNSDYQKRRERVQRTRKILGKLEEVDD